MVIAVACDLSALALNVLVAMNVAHPGFLLLAYVLGLATFVFFVLYLRAVAKSVGESSLAEDAGTVMVTMGVCIGSIFLAALFPLARLLTLGALLYGVYKYLNLLQYMGEQLRR